MAAVTVSVSATQIVGPGAGPTIVQNLGAVPVFFLLGSNGDAVTDENGVSLPAGSSITVENEMWGIVATGSADVRKAGI